MRLRKKAKRLLIAAGDYLHEYRSKVDPTDDLVWVDDTNGRIVIIAEPRYAEECKRFAASLPGVGNFHRFKAGE